MKNYKAKRPLGLLIFVAVFAAFAVVVMLLWNWLMPAIFGLVTITFWQSAGLVLLCRLLLGGFGKMGPGQHAMFAHKHHHHRRSPAELRQMRERFRKMSNDERREYIRTHMDGHCGPWGPEGGDTGRQDCGDKE